MITSSAEVDAQRRRAATNQSLFREVNERIEDLATGSFASFICECMMEWCDERVAVTLVEYEKIRAHPARFFVLGGHEDPEVERTVETSDRYLIVEKLGAGEMVAVRLDPRRRH
jgi:hypothetical protein